MEKLPGIRKVEFEIGDVVGLNEHGPLGRSERVAYELKEIEDAGDGSSIGVVWLPGDDASIRRYPLEKLIHLER